MLSWMLLNTEVFFKDKQLPFTSKTVVHAIWAPYERNKNLFGLSQFPWDYSK